MTRHALTLLALAALTAARADSPAPDPLPVKNVALFTSGVAYTERGGMVEGNASVPLSFPTAQINDLLKSLVLIDGGGQVQPVTYGAHDPLTRTLQSFAIDVTQSLSRADLLGKLRGARVSVITGPSSTITTGQIVSVETRTVRKPDGTVTDTLDALNLLTDMGLQQIDLSNARVIKILDLRLDAEFRQALTTLASGTDDTHRPVTLHFAGSGRRAVRVGYVTEAPLWKISYRLVLDKSPYLQGWALVENTTDDDWNAVHLSLVSGRPVSFIQDLYQPLYLPRPVVPPDVIASPYPQTHGANMQADRDASGAVTVAPSLQEPAPAAAPMESEQRRLKIGGNLDLLARNGATGNMSSIAGKLDSIPFARPFDAAAMQHSLQAQAQGQSAGEQYAYDIKTPLTLPRQQSAMIPVVAQSIAADKVLLYNADSDPLRPLDAVRLKNNTGLHLKGGPVTLFDGGTYAGDARMDDVSPGETRLVSYAVDLSVTGERQTPDPRSTSTTLAIHRGVLIVTRRQRQETRYTFKSHADSPRTVLVEHPYDAAQTLITPAKADERTPDVYRFAVPVAPGGKPATLTVVTERPLSTEVALFDSDLDTIAAYVTYKDISPATVTALQNVIQKRRAIDDLRTAAQNRTARVQSLTADQDRIRKNMNALDKATALYKRYTSELDAQETQIQSLRTEADSLNAKASAAEDALRASLDTLTL